MAEFTKAANAVMDEVKKAVIGKDECVKKVMAAIISGGHVLIEDVPGVGKTTLAVAFSKSMGLLQHRVQFTPDVLPTDITGFSMYKKETGKFEYQPGAIMCNLFLADEINRTSPKTQSALLEAMEEKRVTVDKITRELPDPFIVIATENPVGTAGTQMLPESQLDRFFICMSIGYPSIEQEIAIVKGNQSGSLLEQVYPVISVEELSLMKREVEEIYVHDVIYQYIGKLIAATREHEMIELGLSPRGTIALTKMTKAMAYLEGRSYCVPSDVKEVFFDVTAHRIFLNVKARAARITKQKILEDILSEVKEPTPKRTQK